MGKYKVVIIDDESLIRNGLRTYIDWAALDVSVAAVCANGRQGVEALLAYAPDIVLTDISMPVMDGIDLLKYARAHEINCQFIFISSYAEFRYAQEALKYNAFDYILKPIEPGALFSCVQRCIEKIHLSRSPLQVVTHDVLQECLRNLLLAVPNAESSLFGLLGKEAKDLSALKLWVLLNPPELSASEREDCIVASISAHVTTILSCNDLAVNNILAANGIAQGDYGVVPATEHIYEGFSGELFRLWQSKLPDADRVDGNDALPSKSVVSTLDVKRMQTALHHAMQTCYHRRRHSLPLILNDLCNYLSAMYHQLEDHYLSPLPNLPTLECLLEQLRANNNLFDLFIAVEQWACDLYASLEMCPAYTSYTRKAIRIIRESYAANLTLYSTAAQLKVSSSYLSTLFKADTGYSFSDYLFRYRMNLARTLLKGGEYKIYEIGEMVGYPDVVQFSKRFKQLYAVSPRQMRQSLNSDVTPTVD